MHFLAKISALLLFLFICFSSEAQTTDTVNDSYQPFDSISNKLELKYNIKFFYDPYWFEGKVFSTNLTELPLEQALNIITQITQLSVTKFKASYYVFSLESIVSKQNPNSDFYEIGDIIKYGSSNIANISGKIMNISNNPLLGVKIFIEDLNKSIVTNSNGKFNVNVPVGEHQLKLEYPGYETKITKIKVYSDGSISLSMDLKTILLDEVSVTANKVDQYFRRTKMSTISIDSKTIKQLPTYLGEIDIIKGIALLPGVQTTGEFGSGFNVRGGSSDQNLILLEEVPLFSTSHLFGLISIINPDIVQKTTLYKGAVPVTYGERASSILAIKMGNEEMKSNSIVGGLGLLNCRLSANLQIKNNLKIMIGGRTSYSDWLLKRIPDIELKNSSAYFNDFNVYINYKPNKNDELIIFSYLSNDNFNFSDNVKYNYGNKLGSISYSHRFNSKLYSNIITGISNYNANIINNDPLFFTESYKFQNSILYNNLKLNLIYNVNDKHILTFGVNGAVYNINPGEVSPYGEKSNIDFQSVKNEKGFEWAPFIGDDYEINDKVSIEGGIRFSNFSCLGEKTVYKYDPLFSRSYETIIDSTVYPKGKIANTRRGLEPRLSIKFNTSHSSSVRLSYTKMNQYVCLVSNTSVASPVDFWKLSDQFVKPVISNQIAIGYYKDFNYKSSKFETSIEFYYKKYRNLNDYKNGAQLFLNNHIETELLSLQGESKGMEIYIRKNSGKVNGWISYTFSKSIRKTNDLKPPGQINQNKWFPDNVDKPHNLVINGAYFITKRWKFGLTFNYSTGRPVTLPELKYNIRGSQLIYYSDRNKYRMPDYHRLDISLSQFESLKLHKKWKGYWTFSVINVYGRTNAYSIFYKREKSLYSTLEYSSTLYKLYIIGKPLPTVTYNFIF